MNCNRQALADVFDLRQTVRPGATRSIASAGQPANTSISWLAMRSMISSLMPASQLQRHSFLLEGINCGPGQPKNATTTGQ